MQVHSQRDGSARLAARRAEHAGADGIGLFLIGTGREPWAMPDELRARFRQHNITVETARTGSAISTYNILLGEGRRVAAGLIAVE